MTENQLFLDKAIALCFFYRNRFGYGEAYESVFISQFVHKFDFMNVRDSSDHEYSIGILHQRSLVTVIFCDRPNAFKDSQDAYITHTLYAGKLGPRKDRESYYSNTVKLIHSPQTKTAKTFMTSLEIIQNLGQIISKDSAPININRVPILEIVFDKDGRICDIKKGL